MSIGNYEAYELGLILNIPINDKVSSRWNFRKLAHQGYYDNLYTEKDSGQLDIAAASARFLIEASEILKFILLPIIIMIEAIQPRFPTLVILWSRLCS